MTSLQARSTFTIKPSRKYQMRKIKDGVSKADVLSKVEQTRRDLTILEQSIENLSGLMEYSGIHYAEPPKEDIWGKNLVEIQTYARYISHRLYNLENFTKEQ